MFQLGHSFNIIKYGHKSPGCIKMNMQTLLIFQHHNASVIFVLVTCAEERKKSVIFYKQTVSFFQRRFIMVYVKEKRNEPA
jgi:hypothetical protein